MQTLAPKKFKTVDEYVAAAPEAAQPLLHVMRNTIRKAAPQAEEVISYNMPAFKWNGIVVYYAAYKAHVGFYPAGAVFEEFKADVAQYKTSKGTIQFPLDQEIPVALVTKIVKRRVQQNAEKATAKKAKRT